MGLFFTRKVNEHLICKTQRAWALNGRSDGEDWEAVEEGEERPEGHLLIKSKEYSQELHYFESFILLVSFLTISYTIHYFINSLSNTSTHDHGSLPFCITPKLDNFPCRGVWRDVPEMRSKCSRYRLFPWSAINLHGRLACHALVVSSVRLEPCLTCPLQSTLTTTVTKN